MFLKSLVYDALYIFTNYIVSYIPVWTIRKIFYMLLGLKIGKNSRINMKCCIYEPWHICIGTGTIVNEYSILDGRGGLEIGNNCSISMYSIIYSASHKCDNDFFEYYEKETKIRNGVWLGVRTVILPGTIINDNCIIGANSVVTSGEYGGKKIYAGTPARMIRERKIEDIHDLKHEMYFR